MDKKFRIKFISFDGKTHEVTIYAESLGHSCFLFNQNYKHKEIIDVVEESRVSLEVENAPKFNNILLGRITKEIFERSNMPKYEMYKMLESLNKEFKMGYKIGTGGSHIWISGQDDERYAIVSFDD